MNTLLGVAFVLALLGAHLVSPRKLPVDQRRQHLQVKPISVVQRISGIVVLMIALVLLFVGMGQH